MGGVFDPVLGVAPLSVVSGILPFTFSTPPMSVRAVSPDVSPPCPSLLFPQLKQAMITINDAILFIIPV